MTPRAWKRLFSRIVFWIGMAVALVLLFFLGSNTWSMYGKNQEATQASTDEADQLAELQARQEALSADLSALDTERGVDAKVRETYPVAKSGEQVIVLTDNPQAATGTGAQSGWSPWQWLTSLFSW
jgi:cell division protein FtsB